MKKLLPLLLVFAGTIMMSSCEKKHSQDLFGTNEGDHIIKSAMASTAIWPGDDGCGLQNYELIGGQHIPMGTVSVLTYAGSVFVKYEANEGCLITETHLFLGDVENDLPVGKNGNPKIGHFPVSWSDVTGSQTVIHKVALDDLGSCFEIAAHAVVSCADGEETAWAKGSEELVIALKTRIESKSGKTWALTGMPATGEWCNYFTSIPLSEAMKDVVPLVLYYDGLTKLATLRVKMENDKYLFTIASDYGEIFKSYLFVGTEEELAIRSICNYIDFPYSEISPEDDHVFEHVIEVPVTQYISKEFAGNRWGWYVGYCIGPC